MGILDELKQQAHSLRAAEADEAARLAEQEAYYAEVLRPAMLNVLAYLDELVKHINYVQPERPLSYPLAPDRETQVALAQGQFKLLIDSSDSPRQIDVRVSAKLSQPALYVIGDLASIRHYSEHLDSYGLAYHRQDSLNSAHKVDKATFTLEGPLHHAVRIQADAEQQCIEILLRNFGRPGVQRHRFTPDKLNDALLDRLGRLLLHDIDSLPVPNDVSEETRQQLRQTLAKKKQQEAESSPEAPELEAAKVRDRLKQSWAKKMQEAKALYRKKQSQDDHRQ
ncbi:hypothetical protein [Gilvimarinus agarilyticus]|uniref:hypothetical protein n=1 Tax=Gilvimarinus agarilyticus TaxID=679259 RepID=UPI0005A2B29B|nr:hypothetical protein [Gilvimarinus agarilyticus]